MNTENLASCLGCTRDEFGLIFDLVLNLEKARTKPYLMQVMGVPPGENERAFARALGAAETDGWLDALWAKLEQVGHVTRTPEAGPATVLQQFVDKHSGFQDPAVINRMMPKRMSQVCLLDVDQGDSTGSGFLVGPNTVLTSWHVISRLLDGDDKPVADSHKRIRVCFNHITHARKQEDYAVIEDEWLVAYSKNHPTEQARPDAVTTDNFTDTTFKGCLDYAIIALTASPGNERSYADLASAVTPADGSTGYVLQHPEAFELKIASGAFNGFRPGSGKERLLYGINTLSGSSGGMVVDAEFNLVGLHQGSIPELIDGEAMNTGISARAIWQSAGTRYVPHASTVLQFRRYNNSGPIIGRENCQAWINDCRSGQTRIAHVYVGRRNKGASFSYEIMRACLPEAENRITVVSAIELPVRADAAAAFLLTRMDAPGVVSLPRQENPRTTIPAWIRSDLLPAFRDQLNAVNEGALRWLVIDNIDSEPLPDTDVRWFLEALYQQIESMPNLRIVLIGLRTLPPGANTSLVKDEEIRDPEHDEICRYLRMRYTETKIEFDGHGGEINRLATLVERSGSSAIEVLGEYVHSKVDKMIDDAVMER